MVDSGRAHYKVKPIIYTGERYYDDFLKEEFRLSFLDCQL
jgi:hypothetical protein